jgi:hypothetical protein
MAYTVFAVVKTAAGARPEETSSRGAIEILPRGCAKYSVQWLTRAIAWSTATPSRSTIMPTSEGVAI